MFIHDCVVSSALHKRRPQGVSFLEIIIVLFLFGLFAGISFPNFVRLATSPVELEASKLSNVLRDLQALSILTSKEIRLTMETEYNRMRILSRDDNLEWIPHEKYPEPIPMIDGVRIKSFDSGNNINAQSSIHINILPSGFIDIFSVELYDDEYTLKLQTEGVLGKVFIGEITQNASLF